MMNEMRLSAIPEKSGHLTDVLVPPIDPIVKHILQLANANPVDPH